MVHKKDNIKINIFGSCVSRDVLEYQQERYIQLLQYFARQSIVSAVSKSVPLEENQLSLASSFQKRMVLHDFKKDTFDELSRNSGDYLLIDLIDERFPLVKIDDSFVTYSNELACSNYLDNPILVNKTKKISYCNKLLGKDSVIWKVSGQLLDKYILRFCKLINSIYLPEQIIIHEVYLSNQYLNKHGEKCSFPENYFCSNNRTNQMYEYMYKKIYEYMPNVNRINMSKDFLADETHKWGLQPMHFQREYYETVLEEIYQLDY